MKNQNQLQEDKLPFFDFSSLKSRTFQIILASTFVSSFGMFVSSFSLFVLLFGTFVSSFGTFVSWFRAFVVSTFGTFVSSFGTFYSLFGTSVSKFGTCVWLFGTFSIFVSSFEMSPYFFLPLSHLFICPPYGTSRSKPHIKWNYVQECSHRLFCFFNKASWKESHWEAQPQSRYCRMSESANKT